MGTRGLHATAAADAKILASDPIEAVCRDILKAKGHELVSLEKTPKPAELLKMIGEYEGLIVRSGTTVTKEVMEAGKKLRVIGRAGVGVDNVDLVEATRR